MFSVFPQSIDAKRLRVHALENHLAVIGRKVFAMLLKHALDPVARRFSSFF
jgi:hypothetical protein